jgi:hypothetical protein
MSLKTLTNTEPVDELMEADFRNELSRDFAKAMDATHTKTHKGELVDIVHAYKQVELEFIRRAANDEFEILELKRCVAEAILKAAIEGCRPFETCTQLWNDLLHLGFSRIDRTCTMTWYYAQCCFLNKQTETGLSLLEPLIADLKCSLEEPTVDENAAEYYQYELDNLGKLLGKLQAQRKAAAG